MILLFLVAGNVASSSNSEREESLVLDEEDDILIYSNSEITVFAFAEVLNALQTANAASLTDMDRVCAVIKALLPAEFMHVIRIVYCFMVSMRNYFDAQTLRVDDCDTTRVVQGVWCQLTSFGLFQSVLSCASCFQIL